MNLRTDAKEMKPIETPLLLARSGGSRQTLVRARENEWYMRVGEEVRKSMGSALARMHREEVDWYFHCIHNIASLIEK